MLLNMTPSGNELLRKMLLTHSSKIRTAFILLLIILIPLCLFIGNHYSRVTTIEETSDCLKYVARITTSDQSVGTAFLISDLSGDFSGRLLTARHVVAESVGEQVSLEFPYIEDENGDPLCTTASVIWTTQVPFDGADLQTLRYDVALLELDDKDALPEDVTGFMIGQNVTVRDEIDVFGFPLGEPYYASGEVANESYKGNEDLFVMNIQTEKGHSGSPVYKDDEQEVIGIAIASQEGTDLMNIALKISRVMELMGSAGITY